MCCQAEPGAISHAVFGHGDGVNTRHVRRKGNIPKSILVLSLRKDIPPQPPRTDYSSFNTTVYSEGGWGGGDRILVQFSVVHMKWKENNSDTKQINMTSFLIFFGNDFDIHTCRLLRFSRSVYKFWPVAMAIQEAHEKKNIYSGSSPNGKGRENVSKTTTVVSLLKFIYLFFYRCLVSIWRRRRRKKS